MITVKRYKASDESIWNDFIANSANATFILDRRFLEYHKERFRDHSLMLYDGVRLTALFPANQSKAHITSHGGLTYGGLIVGLNTKLLTTLSCFYAVLAYYHQKGFKKVLYKPVPSFFHIQPFYHDIYALFLAKAKFTAVNTGFVTDMRVHPVISARRMRLVRKAQKHGITIVKARDCRRFWNEILMPHLAKRFTATPVHTADEIELLRNRFPKNIIQYHAVGEKKIIAGVTIFWDRGIAHSQYIAGSEVGREAGALDYLFWRLMTHEFKQARYFSLGTTNMGSLDGKDLSHGLVEWKEGFGAHMFPYPCYTIETNNYKALEAYT